MNFVKLNQQRIVASLYEATTDYQEVRSWDANWARKKEFREATVLCCYFSRAVAIAEFVQICEYGTEWKRNVGI